MKKSKKTKKSPNAAPSATEEIIATDTAVAAEPTNEPDQPAAPTESVEPATPAEPTEPTTPEAKPTEPAAVPEAEPAKPVKKSHKKCLAIILVIIVLLLIGSGAFLFYALQSDFRTNTFQANLTIDYKSEYTANYGGIRYCNLFSCEDVEVTSEGTVDTDTIGDYEITFTIKHQDRQITLSQTVSVRDISAPVIDTDTTLVSLCPDGKIPPFKYTITDTFDGDLTDKGELKRQDDKIALEATDAAGNKITKLFDIADKDTEAPVIKLNGKDAVETRYGLPYYDFGATATDNCDDSVAVAVDNPVNPNAIGEYTITYTATDAAGNQSTATRLVKVINKPLTQPTDKVIYLTFDDGPSSETFRLLDILKKYNVKATFFVTGNAPDEAIVREWQEGHSIGLHTLTHTYSVVYQSDEAFMQNLYADQERVRNLTGYTSTLMRFPGGSSNTVSRNYNRGIMSRLVKTVTEKGFTYFDWNVSSGDAGGAKTSDQVYYNVINSLKPGRSVVLQHDTKGFSIDAVERIIQYGLNNGYTFDRLEPGYFGAHHGVNN